MAKDPAFLFYPGDWQGGTMYLTHEQKGCYMDLLILQFNQGKFTLAQAKQVLSICFDLAWPMLQQKFSTDGKFFWNERLNKEIERRQKFTKSRRDNALSPKKEKKHMPKHMETENKDEDETKDLNKEGGSGEGKFVIPRMCKIWYDAFPTYSADKKSDAAGMGNILWFIAKQHNLGQVNEPETQEKILATLQQVANEVTKDNFWVNKSIKSIANHIQEFYNKIKNPTDGQSNSSTQKRNGYHSKTAGQDVFVDRLKDKLSNVKP